MVSALNLCRTVQSKGVRFFTTPTRIIKGDVEENIVQRTLRER